MDFSREPYVRIYPGVGKTSQQWGFFGRQLMDALVRDADRAGVLELDATMVADSLEAAVAAALRCPDPAWVGEHLPKLIDHGAVVLVKEHYLIVMRYHEAQYEGTHSSTTTLLSRRKKRDTERAIELGLISPPQWYLDLQEKKAG